MTLEIQNALHVDWSPPRELFFEYIFTRLGYKLKKAGLESLFHSAPEARARIAASTSSATTLSFSRMPRLASN